MKETVEINGTIPTSADAERSILGAILLDNAAFNEAAGQIDAADFSLDSHRRIFGCMVEMAGASQPIDLVTLTEELRRTDELVRVGDYGYVSDLIVGVPERPSIAAYINIVRNHSHGRALLQTSKLSIERIIDGDDSKDVAAGMLQRILDVEERSGLSRPELCKDFAWSVIKQIQAQAAGDGLVGLPTGLNRLDKALGGLRNGELIVVGARPGAGKTALAAQMAITNAEAGTAVAFFSLEMSKSDLCVRFYSAVSTVPAIMLRNPKLIGAKDPMWRELANTAGKIAEWPLWVDDNGSLAVSEIVARAKLLIARHGVKLVVVDYLQLVRANAHDIRERVGMVADQLRILAKSEKVPVVLLSQLRRPAQMKDEPTLIDLKESGDIEAHAHVVLLIHSPVGLDMRPTGEDRIIVAKNRNGVRGQEPVRLNTDKLLFYSRVNVDGSEHRRSSRWTSHFCWPRRVSNDAVDAAVSSAIRATARRN